MCSITTIATWENYNATFTDIGCQRSSNRHFVTISFPHFYHICVQSFLHIFSYYLGTTPHSFVYNARSQGDSRDNSFHRCAFCVIQWYLTHRTCCFNAVPAPAPLWPSDQSRRRAPSHHYSLAKERKPNLMDQHSTYQYCTKRGTILAVAISSKNR
jgi:hypothetical protein